MAYRNGQVLDFVTTPTEGWLRESLKTCRSRLLVASPYVNEGFTQVLREISPSVKTTLVTKTDLRDFAMGSSNLETLCTLAIQGVRVLSLTGLHAKVYVFDRSRALITSANATWSGLLRNRELGVAVSEPSAVSQVASLVLDWAGCRQSAKEGKRVRVVQSPCSQLKLYRRDVHLCRWRLTVAVVREIGIGHGNTRSVGGDV